MSKLVSHTLKASLTLIKKGLEFKPSHSIIFFFQLEPFSEYACIFELEEVLSDDKIIFSEDSTLSSCSLPSEIIETSSIVIT